MRVWRNWQTRTVQVRMEATPWGFKSLHPHHLPTRLLSGAFFFPRRCSGDLNPARGRMPSGHSTSEPAGRGPADSRSECAQVSSPAPETESSQPGSFSSFLQFWSTCMPPGIVSLQETRNKPIEGDVFVAQSRFVAGNTQRNDSGRHRRRLESLRFRTTAAPVHLPRRQRRQLYLGSIRLLTYRASCSTSRRIRLIDLIDRPKNYPTVSIRS